MKKIMFNDKCGLTQAVLEGRKTQTRRIAYMPNGFIFLMIKIFNSKSSTMDRLCLRFATIGLKPPTIK